MKDYHQTGRLFFCSSFAVFFLFFFLPPSPLRSPPFDFSPSFSLRRFPTRCPRPLLFRHPPAPLPPHFTSLVSWKSRPLWRCLAGAHSPSAPAGPLKVTPRPPRLLRRPLPGRLTRSLNGDGPSPLTPVARPSPPCSCCVCEIRLSRFPRNLRKNATCFSDFVVQKNPPSLIIIRKRQKNNFDIFFFLQIK